MKLSMMERQKRTLFFVLFAVILAIEAIVCFTPLGSLPALGPIVATLAMIPVTIAGILMGPIAGALMGFFAGTFSFIVWTFMPPPLSIAFAFVFTPFNLVGENAGSIWSLVICFVPRIMTGLMAGFLYTIFRKRKLFTKSPFLLNFLSGFFASLVNTFGVLSGIFLFFRQPYASVLEKTYALLLITLLTTVLTSGIPEAVLAGLASHAVCHPTKKHIFKGDVSVFSANTEYTVSVVAITLTIVLYVVGAILN